MKGKVVLKELNADCDTEKKAGIDKKFTESYLIFACVWKILNFAHMQIAPQDTLGNPMKYIYNDLTEDEMLTIYIIVNIVANGSFIYHQFFLSGLLIF